MQLMGGLNDLREHGKLVWAGHEHGWIADPNEVVTALSRDGFQECKHEIARTVRERRVTGGVWQGLNTKTGAVASAVWVERSQPGAIVFLEIDGEPLRDDR